MSVEFGASVSMDALLAIFSCRGAPSGMQDPLLARVGYRKEGIRWFIEDRAAAAFDRGRSYLRHLVLSG